jgi:hypothetical protein
MVKRIAYCLIGPYKDDTREDIASRARLNAENDALHSALNTCKNQISRYYHNRKWDNFKKFTNEYELVCTSSSEFPGIASHVPVSRSFFKMWEILHDHVSEMLPASRRSPMCAVFLAEGPGGFMESFAKFRSDAGHEGDSLHGMTLISKHKSIPNWKVHSLRVAPNTRVRIHRGADGTGDLYNLRNVDRLVAEVGEASSHLVTADGGFDFSHDFNNQEEASMRLILSEVYAALRLQRLGGSFVLKVYDIHASATLRLLFALRRSYRGMRIVKPLTSRPANSEKYVVCTRFTGAPEGLLAALRAACLAGGTARSVDHTMLLAPTAFLRDVVHYNAFYVARQVCYIGRTISFIRDDDAAVAANGATGSSTGGADTSGRLRRQLCKSIRWCHKYGITTSMDALLKYRPMVTPLVAPSS